MVMKSGYPVVKLTCPVVKLTKAEAEEKVATVARSEAFQPKGYFSPVQKKVITEVALALLIEFGMVEIEE